MKLNQRLKNNKKLIGGVIGSILSVIIFPLIYDYLKPESKSVPSVSLVMNSGQKIKNNGIVKGDIVGRDMITNNYFPNSSDKVKADTGKKKEAKTSKQMSHYKSSAKIDTLKKVTQSPPPIINNGIMNQGGINNTYNQTVNPAIPQRHLAGPDEEFLRKVVGNKIVYFNIRVYNYDKESIVYGNNIAKFLKSKNAIQMIDPFSEELGPVPTGKIGQCDIETNKDTTQLTFIIYPLQ